VQPFWNVLKSSSADIDRRTVTPTIKELLLNNNSLLLKNIKQFKYLEYYTEELKTNL